VLGQEWWGGRLHCLGRRRGGLAQVRSMMCGEVGIVGTRVRRLQSETCGDVDSGTGSERS
jgi:hypothetical protein